MASRTLYPPMIDTSEPAFIAKAGGRVKVFFYISPLSSFDSYTNLTAHARLLRSDNASVINSKDGGNKRYRTTDNLILNIPVEKANEKNLYFIVLQNEDLMSEETIGGTTYKGFIPGRSYKVQVRLSTVKCDLGKNNTMQEKHLWLKKNASNFSEWSSYCYLRAIGNVSLQIPAFGYDSARTNRNPANSSHYLSNLEFKGSLSFLDCDERYDHCTVSLYNDEGDLEEEADIFPSEESSSYFSHKFRYNFIDDKDYTIKFTYVSENGYKPDKKLTFKFKINKNTQNDTDAVVLTIENDITNSLKEKTSLWKDEEEGRVAIKLYSKNGDNQYFGNLCIVRAKGSDHFAIWEDIKIITLKGKPINHVDIIYDYTIESGEWYKYGVQSISEDGVRGKINFNDESIIHRIFDNSFLLGKGEKQLKLAFNNEMSSFKYNIIEQKTDTIGSQYPFVSRNGVVKYRTFPINGLISKEMDDENTFLENGLFKNIYETAKLQEMVEEEEMDELKEYGDARKRTYFYEKEFRQRVMDFLMNDEPKLFKSPTEGNIIVRLMDVNFSPDQQLGRMIYSFTANAVEIDDNTLENYIKYGFFNPGTYSTDFKVFKKYIGQISGYLPFTENKTSNILEMISEKYCNNKRFDNCQTTVSGEDYMKSLVKVQNIAITFDGKPFKVETAGGVETMGNNIRMVRNGDDKTITTYQKQYIFDNMIDFCYDDNKKGSNELYLLGDKNASEKGIYATIDFIYEASLEPVRKKAIEHEEFIRTYGMVFKNLKPNDSVYGEILYSHYYEDEKNFRHITHIMSVEIEAEPHSVFRLERKHDSEEGVEERYYVEINETGILDLHNLIDYEIDDNTYDVLIYLGKRIPETDYDESTLSKSLITADTEKDDIYGSSQLVSANSNAKITYEYFLTQGTYKDEDIGGAEDES